MTRRSDDGQQVIVLDNCALNDILLRKPLGDLAEDIRIGVIKQQIAVWTSPSLVDETVAGSGADPGAVRTKLAFLQAVSRGHMLKYPVDLIAWEGVHGGCPSDRDRFMGGDEEEAVYKQSLAVCDAGGIARSTRDGQEGPLREFIYEEKVAGQLAALEAAEATRALIIRAFDASLAKDNGCPSVALGFRGREAEVSLPVLGRWIRLISREDFADWVSDMMGSLGYKRIIAVDDLPLLAYTTSMAGYLLAKIAGNYVTGQTWKRNDTYDARYCIAASQADILVTLDEQLRQTCLQMPYRSFEIGGVVDLRDFLVPASPEGLKEKT